MKTGPLLTVNAISKTPVVALTVCRRIIVQEDPSIGGAWPTSQYLVYAPTNTDSPRQKDSGQEHPFVKPDRVFFVPGEIAGYLALPVGGGSTSFSQYEDGGN